MFKPLLAKLRKTFHVAGRADVCVPDGTRVYAIGDIHGRSDLLDKLHKEILNDGQNCDAQRKVVIYLGDYVDRGLDSKGVLDRLTDDTLPGFERVFLKGNHEDALLKFLREPQFGRDWKYYGGLETLMSYGVKQLPLKDDEGAFGIARDELQELLPSTHLRFLSGLAYSHSEGGYFFAHAGVRPGLPLEEQAPEDLMWIREEFLDDPSDFGGVVVHGHTPDEAPVLRDNRIGIDTGAYITGVLTCLVLDGKNRRFLQSSA